jgi:hypothetical protein
VPDEQPRWCRPKLVVEIIEARPNPLFSEAQRELVRFLRYYESGKLIKMPCAHCGKKKSVLWTQLCSFKALDFPKNIGFALKPAPDAKVYPPLTGVCQTHLMVPEMEDVDEHGNTVDPEINPPAEVNPPSPHDACADQGLQVTAEALAELGPVGASIEAAEALPRSPLVPIYELDERYPNRRKPSGQ